MSQFWHEMTTHFFFHPLVNIHITNWNIVIFHIFHVFMRNITISMVISHSCFSLPDGIIWPGVTLMSEGSLHGKKSDAQRHGLRGFGFPRAVQETAMAIEKSYNWLILWDYPLVI